MVTSTRRVKPRVMVDTTILFAGTIWPRWPYEVLQHALRGDFQLVVSPLIVEEARRTISAKFPASVPHFETFMSLVTHEVVPNPTAEEILAHQDLMRDINDLPLALAAINAHVDYFVSEDKDFTARDETTARLQQRLTIMLSGTFLRHVMGWTSDELEGVRQRKWSDLV